MTKRSAARFWPAIPIAWPCDENLIRRDCCCRPVPERPWRAKSMTVSRNSSWSWRSRGTLFAWPPRWNVTGCGQRVVTWRKLTIASSSVRCTAPSFCMSKRWSVWRRRGRRGNRFPARRPSCCPAVAQQGSTTAKTEASSRRSSCRSSSAWPTRHAWAQARLPSPSSSSLRTAAPSRSRRIYAVSGTRRTPRCGRNCVDVIRGIRGRKIRGTRSRRTARRKSDETVTSRHPEASAAKPKDLKFEILRRLRGSGWTAELPRLFFLHFVLHRGHRFCSVDVDGNVDVIAEQCAAVVECTVPLDSVVLAVECRMGYEAGALFPLRVFGKSKELDGDGDGLGDAVHREGAGDVVHVFLSARFDAGALERNLRILVDFKEVVPAEIIVARGDAGIDGSGLDREFDRRQSRVVAIHAD